MKIHEYQAKEILRKYGVTVPYGKVAFSGEEAFEIAKEISSKKFVVKAQIHAGGRGKGGGVKLANSPEEVKKIASEMIGMKLVTHQTGPEGKEVKRVLIEEGINIARELYLGVVLDRAKSQYVFMASTEGGVEIEKVAAETPEKIIKEYIDPSLGLSSFQARRISFGLGLSGNTVKKATKFIVSLYRAFIQQDASLAEINPLVITKEGDVVALDAKINFDDNALYRHPEYKDLRDIGEEDPLEVEASKYGLNYIHLDGNVGCMVNGAGLAMSTMDIIKLAGGEPANFLDVGGGASVEAISNGFKIVLSDKRVKGILVNIFGGIVRCDRVARGIIEAAKSIDVDVPMVIRLRGTNAVEGSKLLKESGLSFTVAENFKEAAENVVELINKK
ncbi:ADP-forming succinate--CoA ligase subunit beta [candidate division KSB1 bacterium]|mgnify:CR=1 FL=1|nr:MAG: ADP-forming succinate--CoA ligase subunit beta [candidate division KSB1 bacterium]